MGDRHSSVVTHGTLPTHEYPPVIACLCSTAEMARGSHSCSPSTSTASTASDDSRIEATLKIVNWDAAVDIACKHHGAQTAYWGDQKSGGYNLVRFLHIEGENESIVVVRVPLQPEPEEEIPQENMQALCDRIASEVATMQYIEAHTEIPVPHVISYSTKVSDDGLRSPYIMMSKVEGEPLSDFWDEMPDEKRDIVLRQIVDIYLELDAHRFDKIGALLKREGKSISKDAWYIAPLSNATDANDPITHAVSHVTYTSGTDYWIALANSKLEGISEQDFGSESKIHDYSQTWFLRSLIPSLYDPSLDVSGFPLVPGDFHSQNIFITDADSEPRITAVIDWEFSSTTSTSSFAQFPFFIVDHPAWPDDHPLRPRNIRDQATFVELISKAEREKDPKSSQQLSRAFANCLGVYLFEQSIMYPIFSSVLYPKLFGYVFGDNENFRGDYHWALMEGGILSKETKQFDIEAKVWQEARSVLGEEVADKKFTRSEFVELARKNETRFQKDGKVLKWKELAGAQYTGSVTRVAEGTVLAVSNNRAVCTFAIDGYDTMFDVILTPAVRQFKSNTATIVYRDADNLNGTMNYDGYVGKSDFKFELKDKKGDVIATLSGQLEKTMDSKNQVLGTGTWMTS